MRRVTDLRRRRVLSRQSVVSAECCESRTMMSAESLIHFSAAEITIAETAVAESAVTEHAASENAPAENSDGSRLVELSAGNFGIASDGRLFSEETNQPFYWKSINESEFLSSPPTGFDMPIAGQPVVIPLGAAIAGRPTTEIELQGVLSSLSTGRKAQRLVSEFALTSRGKAATWATLLNDLDSNLADYIVTDRMMLSGRQGDGSNPWLNDFSVGPTATVGDLMDTLRVAFSETIVELTDEGRIAITSVNPGPSFLTVGFSDAPTNTGRTDFGDDQNQLQIEQVGKDADFFTQGCEVIGPYGETRVMELIITRLEERSWQVVALVSPEDGELISQIGGPLILSDDGAFSHVASSDGTAEIRIHWHSQSAVQTIQFKFGPSEESEGLVELQQSGTSLQIMSNGNHPGYLGDFNIDIHGNVDFFFSNGIRIAAGNIESGSESSRSPVTIVDERPTFEDQQSQTTLVTSITSLALPSVAISLAIEPLDATLASLPSRIPERRRSRYETSMTPPRVIKASVTDWRNALRMTSLLFFEDSVSPTETEAESLNADGISTSLPSLRIIPATPAGHGRLQSSRKRSVPSSANGIEPNRTPIDSEKHNVESPDQFNHAPFAESGHVSREGE